MKHITTQNFLSLDLEMNKPTEFEVQGENSVPTGTGKIIQIGISIGNFTMDDPNAYISRSWYIDPKEPISPEITQLTGINDFTVQKYGVPLEKVAEELSSLIIQYNTFTNPVQWGIGDARILLEEFQQNGITFKHFGHRVIDVKQVYIFNECVQGRQMKGSLKSAMGRYKMKFDGKPHDAMDDAKNTLKLWFELLVRQRDILEGLSGIKQIPIF
jgi:inhibitor of KinA sporulation pathway (predicted exonuclease)